MNEGAGYSRWWPKVQKNGLTILAVLLCATVSSILLVATSWLDRAELEKPVTTVITISALANQNTQIVTNDGTVEVVGSFEATANDQLHQREVGGREQKRLLCHVTTNQCALIAQGRLKKHPLWKSWLLKAKTWIS